MSEIESLLQNIQPEVATMVRRSLLRTLQGMIARVRDDKSEFEQIEREICDENFGSW